MTDNNGDWIKKAADQELERLRQQHEVTDHASRQAAAVNAHAPALLARLRERVRADVEAFQAALGDVYRVDFDPQPNGGFSVKRGGFPAATLTVVPIQQDPSSIRVEYRRQENNQATSQNTDFMLMVRGESADALEFFRPAAQERYPDVAECSKALLEPVFVPSLLRMRGGRPT